MTKDYLVVHQDWQKTGFQITYDKWSHKFTATKGDRSIDADTEPELQELIKQDMRELRKFKPIDVIKVFSDSEGRLTSRVADSESMVWFSHSEDGEKKHTQEMLDETYSWQTKKQPPNFVKASQKNKKILQDIRAAQSQIQDIEQQISTLRDSYEEPVTWEIVNKAAGEKT